MVVRWASGISSSDLMSYNDLTDVASLDLMLYDELIGTHSLDLISSKGLTSTPSLDFLFFEKACGRVPQFSIKTKFFDGKFLFLPSEKRVLTDLKDTNLLKGK